MKQKNKQKIEFSGMLMAKLDAVSSEIILAGKAKIPGQGVITAGEEVIKEGQEF